ncbi:MAG: DnaJ domain-containing protein [Burkholderiales bacterium]|nr:DnaJ domain-containing protein [Burkholderiales bacterium]
MHTQVPDFYACLGVDRAASKESIVAAFRRLAMKWHPDRHFKAADKVEAEKQFKTIKTAYETLTDDSRRKYYDQEDADRQRRASARRGADVNEKVAVTIAEGFNGTHISFEEAVVDHCERCAGQRGEWMQCSRCSGFSKYSRLSVCPVCRNTGQEWRNCGPCHGLGTVTRKRKFTVRTPAGLVDGSVLTVKERGKPSEHGGLNGDLHIAITIKPESGWKRKGLNLSGTLKLPFSIALLGGTIELLLPTGKTVQVQVPARTNAGKKIRLAGQGLFDAANDKRGDVLLSTSIVLPSVKRKLTPEMEAVLRQIDGE